MWACQMKTFCKTQNGSLWDCLFSPSISVWSTRFVISVRTFGGSKTVTPLKGLCGPVGLGVTQEGS